MTTAADLPERIRLVVLFGGQSAEHDVSCVTARHVLAAADRDRYQLESIGITREGAWVRPPDSLQGGQSALGDPDEAVEAVGATIDPLPALQTEGVTTVVFPLLHGPMGEDGTVQGLLELAGVPYVGSGVLGSALAMDKVKAKEVAAQAKIPQADFVGLRLRDASSEKLGSVVERLGLPLFVKPANLGSSIGVSKVTSAAELPAAIDLAGQYDEWAVCEEAIDGREIEVAVLGNEEPRASLPGEVRPASEFYDYEDKYLDGRAELLIPAPLKKAETARVQELAVQAFDVLRAEGMARVDFFYEQGGRGFLLNEVNTIPGFTPISMYPKLWEASGIGYGRLIDELVSLAIERHRRRQAHRSTARRPSLHRRDA